MSRRTVRIGSAQGLHARPAGLTARLVAQSGIKVTIGREGQPPVDAASVLSIMTLNIQHGESVVVTSDADGSELVLEQVAQLLESDLDAPTPV